MTSLSLPLLLVRHAAAEPSHLLGDEARSLTPEGRATFRQQARRIARLTPLTGILTSPYVRAVQTAEVLAEALGLARVEVHAELRPHRRAGERIIRLARETGPGWALVGHNPSLSEALCELLRMDELPFPLKKGAAVALSLEDSERPFRWMLRPGQPPLKAADAFDVRA